MFFLLTQQPMQGSMVHNLKEDIFTFVRMPFYKKPSRPILKSIIEILYSSALISLNEYFFMKTISMSTHIYACNFAKNICPTFLGPYGCQSCSGIRITTAQNYFASLIT